jgi:hypothetical protein
LLFEDGQTLEVALGVGSEGGWSGGGAVDFFAGVKDLESED